jgi:hypothetical protein
MTVRWLLLLLLKLASAAGGKCSAQFHSARLTTVQLDINDLQQYPISKQKFAGSSSVMKRAARACELFMPSAIAAISPSRQRSKAQIIPACSP